jgi:hypothetical protein
MIQTNRCLVDSVAEREKNLTLLALMESLENLAEERNDVVT